MARAALRLLSARQRTLGGVVEDLALRDVATRVARLLLGCLGQHQHIVEQAPDACARITHQEIASMVGSVREVVQRVLKELERDGALAIERGHIHSRDRPNSNGGRTWRRDLKMVRLSFRTSSSIRHACR